MRPEKEENMSWAGDEWKDGLPGKALQKIQEIEGQLDKLKKERQQKQFQMDSLEAALQKQKQKVFQVYASVKTPNSRAYAMMCIKLSVSLIIAFMLILTRLMWKRMKYQS